MFCIHCGKNVKENAVFCEHCGGKLEQIPAADVPTAASRKGSEGKKTLIAVLVVLLIAALGAGGFTLFWNPNDSDSISGAISPETVARVPEPTPEPTPEPELAPYVKMLVENEWKGSVAGIDYTFDFKKDGRVSLTMKNPRDGNWDITYGTYELKEQNYDEMRFPNPNAPDKRDYDIRFKFMAKDGSNWDELYFDDGTRIKGTLKP